jgi:hypothetical protein
MTPPSQSPEKEGDKLPSSRTPVAANENCSQIHQKASRPAILSLEYYLKVSTQPNGKSKPSAISENQVRFVWQSFLIGF